MRLFTRDSLERMGVTTRSVQSERRPRVKLHRNAKTTPHMRALLVDRIRHQQWTPATAASAAGISIRSAYKWLARHQTGGAAPPQDRPPAPHHQPPPTPPLAVGPPPGDRPHPPTPFAHAVHVPMPASTA